MIDELEAAWPVGPHEARRRLDDFLADRIAWLSRTRLRRLVGEGRCQVNGGRPLSPGVRLAAGDAISVRLPPETSAVWPERRAVPMLYEDSELTVVEKPAGMLVHPTLGVKHGTLASALAWHWREATVRPHFVNRLDRLTSGLVVVAKTALAARRLSAEWAARRVEKRYWAVVAGPVPADAGEIDAPIGRVSDDKPQWRVTELGKPALSRWRMLERRGGRVLLEFEPVTGRTNQLRIHCAYLGAPIVGDLDYGGPPAGRLFLHATSLRFRHSAGGEEIRVDSPATFAIDEAFAA